MIETLQLTGTPREVGRQYGEACRERFHAFHALCKERAAGSPRWYDDLPIMGQAIASHHPRYYQELQGMAEGASLELDDVLLNHRRLLLAEFCCSNLAFLEAPGGPIFGKNLDGGGARPDHPDKQFVARHVRYENGEEIIHTTIVGDLMSRDTCMNVRSGLTFGGSSVGSVFQKSLRNPTLEAGLYEMICSCDTVEEAIHFLQRYPYVGKGYNFVIVDEGGNGVVLECACPMVQVRRAKEGQDAVFCTNHFRLPFLLEADRRKRPDGKVYSYKRDRFLEHKLWEERVPRTVEQMKALLSAYGEGGGLCRPIDDGDTSITFMSVVALPAERRYEVAYGRPSDVPYHVIP
jgi:predicted choloylglycine hydrolase